MHTYSVTFTRAQAFQPAGENEGEFFGIIFGFKGRKANFPKQEEMDGELTFARAVIVCVAATHYSSCEHFL